MRRNRTTGQVGTPKNGKGRKVDMSPQLTNVRFLRSRRWATRRRQPTASCVYKVVKKAEIGELRIHDLRHSYASMLIANGESLAYVRDQFGHSRIKVTVDLYGHLVPEGNRQARRSTGYCGDTFAFSDER